MARSAPLFTKWCPTPGPMTAEVVRAGVEKSRRRLGVESIDLLQFHWWSFDHPSYLDAMIELAALKRAGMIRHIGVTNFDTAHLRVLVKHGIPITTNQVSFSLLDRRAAFDMSAFCRESGIRLLAYGTLGGGFISERWLERPEPGAADISDWSKMKYKRFIDAIGGWPALQAILRALRRIAARHGVSIPNVATRWVLDNPAVAAVIVGARLGEREHRADNLAAFSFALDEADNAMLDEALARTTLLKGDCGDEYRRPPLLDGIRRPESPPGIIAEGLLRDGRPGPSRPTTGFDGECVGGYLRIQPRAAHRRPVLVSGTTATNGAGQVVCPGDPAGQTVFILTKSPPASPRSARLSRMSSALASI